MRGRKPHPTKLKVLRGNPGKRPLNKKEPKPDPSIPEPPEHIKGLALKEWYRAAGELHRIGLLTVIDRAALAAYCAAFGRWCECEQQISKTGMLIRTPNGYPIVNPLLSVSNKAVAQMRAFLSEFGMTPAARSRVSAEKPKGDDGDALDAIMKGFAG